MSDTIQNMVAEAIRRRKEIERQQEEAQRRIEQTQREESLPPANHILPDPTDYTSECEAREDSHNDNITQGFCAPSRRRRRSPTMDLITPEVHQ
jgi:hypothetical protein